MNGLRIDFAWDRAPLLRRLGSALFFLTLVGLLAGGWRYLELRRQLESWQADARHIAHLEASFNTPTSPEELERAKTELRFAARVIERLDLPWDALFEAIEHATSEQVALIGIEPDAETRGVKLTAEAKDFAAMLEYLKQVRSSPVLHGAYLAGHQINQQDPQHPVRFSILAPWADPAPELPQPEIGPQALATQASDRTEAR